MEELEQAEAWLLGEEEASENESWVAAQGGERSVGLLQELEYVGLPSPFVLPSANLDAAFHVTQVRRHPLCQHLLRCKLLNHHMVECFDPSPGSTPTQCLKFRASGKNICALLVVLCRKHAEKGSTAVSFILKVKRLQSLYTCTCSWSLA